MKATVEKVTKAVLSLSRVERELVAERIVESLVESADPKILRAQLVEVRRRRQRVLSGKVKTIPGDQVLREVRELLG